MTTWTLSSRQYLSDLRDFFSEHPLMDFPAQVRKSANLHIQDGRHGPIWSTWTLSSRQYSSNLHKIFFEHPLMDYPANLHIQDRSKCSPVVSIYPIFDNFFCQHARKSANLHIQDGRHGLICKSSIFIWFSWFFFWTLCLIVLFEFENLLNFMYPRWHFCYIAPSLLHWQ